MLNEAFLVYTWIEIGVGLTVSNRWAKIIANVTSGPAPTNCTASGVLYFGQNVTCGQASVALFDLEPPNASGVSPAIMNITYSGNLSYQDQVLYPSQVPYIYSLSGNPLYLHLQKTMDGLLYDERWANLTIVYK